MLTESDWKFPNGTDAKVPDWELDAWLNYEYARSYRPMVRSVLMLRARREHIRTHPEGNRPSMPNRLPAFAQFLQDAFPEFPKVAWLSIPEATRHERMRRAGIDEHTSPFGKSTVEVLDLDLFTREIAFWERDYQFGNLDDERMLLLKIDYRHSPDQILRRITAILKQRRQHLGSLYQQLIAKNKERGVVTPAPPDPTQPTANRRNVGKRDNPRQSYDRMQFLATLRVLTHHEGDTAEIARLKYGNFYTAPIGWNAARNKALNTLIRLDQAWKSRLLPTSPCELPSGHFPRSFGLSRRKPTRVPSSRMDAAEKKMASLILKVPGQL